MNILWALNKAIPRRGLRDLLRPVYHVYEDIVEGGVVKKNESLKDLYKNQRCFIFGTGVSLNDVDLSKLGNENTFGCSYLFAHKNFKKLNIKFYVDAGPLWTFISKKEALDFYSSVDRECVNPDTIFFLRATSKRFFEKHKIFQGRRVNYAKSSMPIELANVQSIDLAKRITFLDGSTPFMIAAAIYMGFKELYLCGCGYTYQPQLMYHFHDEYPDFSNWYHTIKTCFSRNIPKAKMAKMIKKIEDNEKVEVYKIMRRSSYNIVRFVRNEPVNRKHKIMKEFAESKGVRIFNIVPDGFESPIYQKASYDFVLKHLLSKPKTQLNEVRPIA